MKQPFGEEPYFGDLPNHLTNWDDPSSKGPTRQEIRTSVWKVIGFVGSNRHKRVSYHWGWALRKRSSRTKCAVPWRCTGAPGRGRGGDGLIERYGTQKWSWFGVHHEATCYMGKSILKWDWQVLSYCPLVMQGFSNCFRVVSSDYGKPRDSVDPVDEL